MFVKPYTTGGLRTSEHAIEDSISFIIAFRRLRTVFSTGKVSLATCRTRSSFRSTAKTKHKCTYTKKITGTVRRYVGRCCPKARIGVRRTRKLTRYGGVLALTGTKEVGKYLVRNVKYPNKYVTKTKAGVPVPATGGSITTCIGGSDETLPPGRLRRVRLGWKGWWDGAVTSTLRARTIIMCCGLNFL